MPSLAKFKVAFSADFLPPPRTAERNDATEEVRDKDGPVDGLIEERRLLSGHLAQTYRSVSGCAFARQWHAATIREFS